jgi:DNA-binding transcriptional regulator YiaG
MSPDDYRATLAALNLSQMGAAKLLGVDERTSRRWAIGERPVPEPVSRFLRLLLAAKISPERALRLIVD